eukprot:GFUD01037398.1.p1 GENE.GFUD01037398.1~~GFUD01037398.1.p1  ORF type:complete len:515 (+),score=153.07 GFUD01037398.1:55-1599(+)
MLVEIILFLLTIFLGLYFYITKHFGYFKANGFPEAPGTFPFGSEHMWDLMMRKSSFLSQFDDLVKKFPDEKCFGIYNFRVRDIVVKDLELAKMILIKEADHFIDRPAINLDGSKIESDKIVNYFLTQLKGEQWKKVRTVVSPVFTSGKLKMMVPHVQKCAENLDDVFAAAAASGEILEAKDVFGKYTLDAIATSGFGIESNSFKEPNSVFRQTALRMVRAEGYGSKLDLVKFFVLIVSPKLAKLLGITMMPSGTVEFFAKIIKQTVEQRRETGKRRNDIIDLLLDEIKKIEDEDDTTETGVKKEDIDMELALISNALIFFFAGFDTSSLTLATVIFSFMDKPDIQEKARQEIEEVIGDSDTITADHLRDLKYLENVINEALRFYGIVNNVQRICTKDYKIPDTDFSITKGMIVNVLPACFANECFFNPDELDPDNFDSNNNPNKFGFTGFGQGPRNCIGMRYAYIALKLALVRTLTKFRVVKCEETVDKLQFDLSKNYFKGGVMFRVEQLDRED